MYRHVFNPYSLRWEIQMLRFGFFWTTLRGACFTDLEDAKGYAKEIGLSAHYREQVPFNHMIALETSNVVELEQP